MELEFEQIKSLISDRFIDKKKQDDSEQSFIDLIAERVAELMESNMELFINHLYRMDIDERKVNRTLLEAEDSEETVYHAMARLIYERQKERLESRRKFRQEPTDFWAED